MVDTLTFPETAVAKASYRVIKNGEHELHVATNQLRREYLSSNALNPFDGADSSSRKQMYGNHLGQALVIKGATERRIQTGVERQYRHTTFNVQMPCDAVILKIIQRYPRVESQEAIAFSPQTLLIYENIHTKEIGMLSIPRYFSFHQYFGFEYKPQPDMNKIHVGAHIRKGTIFMDSPNVTRNGGYMYGREMNIAFMSIPSASEDGIAICKDVLPSLAITTYEHRTIEYGSKKVALNLYGTPENPKPFPDIGEKIREDGLLGALRLFDKEMAIAEQSVMDLATPDMIYDSMTYAAGAGGVVVDIKVHRDNQGNTAPLGGMDAQPDKYDRARRVYYGEIWNFYQQMARDRPTNLELSKPLHRLIVEAQEVMDNGPDRLTRLHRRVPLDDWRIEFVIRYDIIPTEGFKLTDCHGGKGVICKIMEPEDMPVDDAGNRADVIMDPNSTVSRMNLGRLYEQYFNCVKEAVVKKLREDLYLTGKEKNLIPTLKQIRTMEPERWQKAWDYLMTYHQIISEKQYLWFKDGTYKAPFENYMASVLKDGIYDYFPPDNQAYLPQQVKQCEETFHPPYTPVTYRGESGKMVRTVNRVRIGSVYMMLLEKIGDDWTAVSSGKTQHFGVLSQVGYADKYSQPTRTNPIRALGESEIRIYVSYAGPYVTADILDRNNNPQTHRAVLFSILRADKPTDIHSAVDRRLIPLGSSKPLQLLKHIAECSGWKFSYQKFDPQWEPARQAWLLKNKA